MDIGSSTGGFTDFALKHGAMNVIAIDKGTNQMDRRLRFDSRVDLFEKTDIRHFNHKVYPDIIMMDVSFISLKAIMHSVMRFCGPDTICVVLAKPQFEARPDDLNHGVVKNDTIQRRILKELESWLKSFFLILDKADSEIEGLKGNRERFYMLKRIR